MSNRSQILNKLPFAPIVAAVFGLVATFLIFAMPPWLFERAVMASGLPSVIAAAHPPLGDTARLICAIAAGLGTAVGLWAVLSIVSRITKARIIANSPKARGVRLDPVAKPTAHRAPIFAEQELGAPFMSQEAIDVATSELILEAPVVEAPAAETVEDIAPVEAQALPLPVEAVGAFAEPHPAPEAKFAPVAAAVSEGDSISGLMSRLEAALSRRAGNSMPGRAIRGGDIAALRRAIGAGL